MKKINPIKKLADIGLVYKNYLNSIFTSNYSHKVEKYKNLSFKIIFTKYTCDIISGDWNYNPDISEMSFITPVTYHLSGKETILDVEDIIYKNKCKNMNFRLIQNLHENMYVHSYGIVRKLQKFEPFILVKADCYPHNSYIILSETLPMAPKIFLNIFNNIYQSILFNPIDNQVFNYPHYFINNNTPMFTASEIDYGDDDED